ncbi:O-antigen ligase family protein [Pseudoduganella namucuonensis]|uniref:O-antigen ligase n=1 Tax=Pseudoduganella namucuonensis TaxID=1035707 RepID=A0A1I7K2N3_9BURK|nr:O-antigen ligase family protein [Pseudoduganella namucuonensis]SFU91652.1 O-antigen ligase [Pseudoduganella namucuonensis]
MSATPAEHGPAPARQRWMAWPFLVFMACSGMPLTYSLVPSRPMLVSDVADMTYAAAASGNSLNSLFNMVLLAVLYGASGAVLLRHPRDAALLVKRHWPLPALILLLGCSALWSYQPAKVLLNFVHHVGVILIALAAARHYRCDPWRLPVDLGNVLGLNMALHVAAVILIPAYAIDWQARWQGMTPHPNTLGALAFTTFWANAGVLVCLPHAARRRWHLCACLLAVSAMIGADSVTSKLTSLVALTLLLLLRGLHKRRAGPGVYLAGVALAAASLALFKLLESAVDLKWLFDLLGRDSELTGRSAVWADAWKAIGAKPLLGWSFDDHAYLIASAGMPYSSYHNGVLDLAVNGGAVAVALLAALMLSWACGYLRPGRVGRTIAPFGVAYVLTYMMHNLTEASLLAPRGQLWVIFLVLLLLGACTRQQPRSPEWSGHAT